jgi:hypothetical protein
MGFVVKRFGNIGVPSFEGSSDFGETFVNPYGDPYKAPGDPEPPLMGYCKFSEDAFDATKEFEAKKDYPVPKVDGSFYIVGPFKLTLVARVILTAGSAIAVTTALQTTDPDSAYPLDPSKPQCSDGGRSGYGKGYVKARLEFGGSVDVWLFKGVLAAEIVFFDSTTRYNAEMLSTGRGKEAFFGLKSLSGAIKAQLFARVFRHWWSCAVRVWGSCVFWYPNFDSWHQLLWEDVLFSWAAQSETGNILCGPLTFGCPSYEEDPFFAKLFAIASSVDAFVSNLMDKMAELEAYALEKVPEGIKELPVTIYVGGKPISFLPDDPISDLEIDDFQNKAMDDENGNGDGAQTETSNSKIESPWCGLDGDTCICSGSVQYGTGSTWTDAKFSPGRYPQLASQTWGLAGIVAS